MCTEQGRRGRGGRWVWHRVCCCLEAEVEMQLQRNSWRLWPTASQDAVSCLDAIIKQRQPLCSDTDSTTTQLRTLAHTHAHSRTYAQVTCRLSKLVGMGKLFICCAFMPLIFSFCCALWFFVTLPCFCDSYFASFLNIFLPFHRLTLFLSNYLYFLRIAKSKSYYRKGSRVAYKINISLDFVLYFLHIFIVFRISLSR